MKIHTKLLIHNSKQKVYASFDKSANQLFIKVVWIGIFFSILTAIINFIIGNHSELIASSSFFFTLLIILWITKSKFKKLAYHLVIWVVCVIMMYMVAVKGSDYYAILLLYPVLIVYSFLFFEEPKILYGYLAFLIVNQIIILYYRSDSHINGHSQEMIAEYINVFVYNIIAFFLTRFYTRSIEKTVDELDTAIIASQKQEDKLHKQNVVLEKYIESNKKLENYTHLASHELKAPLRSVKSFADILQQRIEPKLDENEKELFEFISSNTLKMSLLLEDLQKLGKVDATKLKIESLNVKQIFDEILIERDKEIIEKSAIIKFDATVVNIYGQRSMLKQVFSNLVGNGIKFVADGVIPEVKIESKTDEQYHIFKISDNGIGISIDNRAKVFQIFTRLHSETEFKGSGIGLALCKKIIDLHKGIISVEESNLDGTCFTIRLPIEISSE